MRYKSTYIFWFKYFALAWCISGITLFIAAFWNGAQWSDVGFILKFGLLRAMQSIWIWLLLALPYGLFRWGRFIWKGLKESSVLSGAKHLSISLLLPGLLGLGSYHGWKEYRSGDATSFDMSSFDVFPGTADSVWSEERFSQDSVQRGVHFFSRGELDSAEVNRLRSNHIEWITLVPYGWQENAQTPQIGRSNQDYQSWTSRDSSLYDKMVRLREAGFRIMIKPHIWMRTDGSSWRSDIYFDNPAEWKQWSDQYRKFILHYAKMSQLAGAQQFCVGTELHQIAKRKPEFWRSLIQEVRNHFQGSLTYAANWYAECEDVTFWDALDFIGVQGYYPLTEQKNPEVKELVRGWKKPIAVLEKLSKDFDKPILFTELGYKSTPDAGIKPWEWIRNHDAITKPVSYQTQAHCYQAFFQVFWKKSWFAGVHIWEWQSGHRRNRGYQQVNFTPQGKPAEKVIAQWFDRKSRKR